MPRRRVGPSLRRTLDKRDGITGLGLRKLTKGKASNVELFGTYKMDMELPASL